MRPISIVACLLSALLPTAGVFGSNAGPPVQDPIVVGLTEIPPYSFYSESGAPAGILLPLMERVIERAGYQADFRILPIARLVQGMQDGTLDVWPGVENRSDLTGQTLIGESILGHVNINLYYRQDTPEPSWPEDLRGEALILLSNYAYWPPLMQTIQDPAYDIRPQRTVNHAGAIGMLIRKRANFILNYETPMQEALELRPDLQLESITLQRAPIRMIVSSRASLGGQPLLEKLEQAYRELREEKVIHELPEY